MNQPEQVAFEKTYNLWQTSAPSANVKHAFREGHDMGWKNAIKHISRSGEARVMRGLLRQCAEVLCTVEPKSDTEGEELYALLHGIQGVIEPKAKGALL